MDSKSSIGSSMMFDWSDDGDQVGGTLWPDLMVSEDHIVPYPMETEDNDLFASGDYSTNKKNDTADVGSTAQSSGAKNGGLSYKSECRSRFHTSEELSSSRTDMDPWLLDFPNLCIELRENFLGGNSHNSVTELMNDLSDTTNLNSLRGDSMQLDCEPELLSLEDKESGDFLDCDWDTFGDFDDIENLFRKNDAMFGHDIIGNADGFLSLSKDVINSTALSIPLPEIPLCNDQTLNEGCSSVQLDDHSEKHRSPLREEKVDELKITRGSERKVEERRKNRPSYNGMQIMPSTSVHSSVTNPLQTYQPDLIIQQMQYGDAKLMGSHGSSNQVSFTQHGHPTYCFSGTQLPPHIQINSNQKRSTCSSYEVCLDDSKHQKTSMRVLNAEPATLTPREKMDKLRRLQKMQAQLAVEQQHQQFTQTCLQHNQALEFTASTLGIDDCAQRDSSPELKTVAEKDESMGTSSLIYDSPLEETLYYQLHNVVEKLDMRIRLCIRDSLLRLAKSAKERQSASDRSSTSKNSRDEDEVSIDEELRDPDKSTMLANSETGTNPIDRIVAGLLFQATTEACPRAGSYGLVGST